MPDYSNYNARQTGDYSDIWTNTGKCVFCDLKDKYIITERNGVVLTVNIFPYLDGHLMVIPRRHFESLDEFTAEEWVEVLHLTKLGQQLLKVVLEIDRTWLIFRTPKGIDAAKTVTHAHVHLIPFSDEAFTFADDGLNIQYQEIQIPPAKLAERLRKALKAK